MWKKNWKRYFNPICLTVGKKSLWNAKQNNNKEMEQCLKGKEICNIADKNEGDIKKKKKIEKSSWMKT